MPILEVSALDAGCSGRESAWAITGLSRVTWTAASRQMAVQAPCPRASKGGPVTRQLAAAYAVASTAFAIAAIVVSASVFGFFTSAKDTSAEEEPAAVAEVAATPATILDASAAYESALADVQAQRDAALARAAAEVASQRAALQARAAAEVEQQRAGASAALAAELETLRAQAEGTQKNALNVATPAAPKATATASPAATATPVATAPPPSATARASATSTPRPESTPRREERRERDD
ncbi:MAG: hypothetical protein U0360_07500 [Dehalococcoidia bacterium]